MGKMPNTKKISAGFLLVLLVTVGEDLKPVGCDSDCKLVSTSSNRSILGNSRSGVIAKFN